jgi:hypothetical protein
MCQKTLLESELILDNSHLFENIDVNYLKSVLKALTHYSKKLTSVDNEFAAHCMSIVDHSIDTSRIAM